MALNIAATAVPTFALQLVILPALSRFMPDERYGLLVTVLAFLNIVPSTMGNVLNNIRLLFNSRYIEEKQEGDFNLILVVLAIVDMIGIVVFLFFYDRELTYQNLLLIVLVSILWLGREYFIVAFRLKINYVSILICNMICIIGYALGFVLFRITGYWQWIYLLGLLFSLIYCFSRSDLWKEPFKRTPLFKQTSVQGSLLLIAKILNRLITYADKILIYPILGGSVVSVYYAATVFGKVVSIMITPINSVALTYLSKMKKKKDNLFKSALLMGIGVCIVGYCLCLAVSRPVLSVLYPRFVDEAMKYIAITTGTTVLYALTSIVDPFIMKFFDMKWQIAINGSSVVVYLILCLSLLKVWGLIGFCIGAMLTNAIKLVFMILIYYRCRSLSFEG